MGRLSIIPKLDKSLYGDDIEEVISTGFVCTLSADLCVGLGVGHCGLGVGHCGLLSVITNVHTAHALTDAPCSAHLHRTLIS